MCEISDNGAKHRESSGRFYDSVLSKNFDLQSLNAQIRGCGMRSVEPHPFPRQTLLLLYWTILRGLQKYALNEEKQLPLHWMQCQVNQEFSTWRISALCVLETHYLWVLEVKSLFNEIQLSRNSLETPAGTLGENDKTGLAQRDAWNRITTVKISRGKKCGLSCKRESVWHEEQRNGKHMSSSTFYLPFISMSS